MCRRKKEESLYLTVFDTHASANTQGENLPIADNQPYRSLAARLRAPDVITIAARFGHVSSYCRPRSSSALTDSLCSTRPLVEETTSQHS